MHSEHLRAEFEPSQNLSGYKNTHISQKKSTTSDKEKRLRAKNPPIKTIGENIIKWSQLKMRQVVQHLFPIIRRNGHQIRTQIRSNT